MARKTTRRTTKPKKRVVKRATRPAKKPAMKSAMTKKQDEGIAASPIQKTVKPTVSKPVHEKNKAEYMGLHYETWINIILVVAVIIIVGILAGVGALAHNVAKYQAPSLAAQQTMSETGVGTSVIRAKAEKVLNIITGGAQNYNITGIVKSHGVYEIDLSLKTPTGTEPGKAFMSTDGQMMYFRYLNVDQFLQRYQNSIKQVVSNSTNSTQ